MIISEKSGSEIFPAVKAFYMLWLSGFLNVVKKTVYDNKKGWEYCYNKK